jgi:O-antigen/teichoic acid export membrane protein
MRKSMLFFGLRIGSTVLATAWSFLLTYTLVRMIGLQDYAFLATVIAFASLVLQADLGISVRLFSRMRQNFLDPSAGSREDLRSAAATALWAYSAAALLATAVFAAILWIWDLGPAAHRGALVVLFAGSVLPLPWMVLRVAVNAFDHYVLTEAIDCARRAILLALTGALAFGLPLMAYTIGFVLLWAAALAILFIQAQRRIDLFHGISIRRGWQVLREDGAGIAASAQLSFSDFLIYIFPYYVLLLTHAEAAALVAFDMFYKVTRFGVTAYFTVSETMLPHQTRAYHTRNPAAMLRMLGLSFALCAVPCIAGTGIIYFFGDRFFGELLGHPDIVSPHLRLAICAMLVFMMVKAITGSVLAGIGELSPLGNRATLALAAMLLYCTASRIAGWSIDTFVAGYVLLYGCQAASYFLLLLRTFRRTQQAAASTTPQPA